MKKSFLLLLVVLLSGAAWAQTKEINFRKGTVAEIMAQAKAENKPVFIDAYAVWCGPCKWMDKNVFVNDAVADYFNTNYVSYKLDMEKGEGVEMATKYQVQAYPSFLFLNADGSVMHRTVGARPAEMFLEVAAVAKDPAKNFASYQKKYDGGDRSPEFMMSYLKVLNESALNGEEVAEKYFASLKPAQLQERGNWNLIYENINSLQSPVFVNFVKNRDAYAQKYTLDSVENKISNVYGQQIMRAAAQGDDAQLNKLKSEFKALNLKSGEKTLLQADMVYYERQQDMPKFHEATSKFVDKYMMDNSSALNSIAWRYYETIEDKTMLQQAEKWAAKSVSLEPGFHNLDTHAALLYKLGQKEKAQEQAVKAIAAGKKMGEDVSGTEELLDKIKKM